MEQETREIELVVRHVPNGTYAVSVRHDENINGGIRLSGGLYAYAP